MARRSVAEHLFGYCVIVVTRCGAISHTIVPCIWVFFLVQGLATILTTLFAAACLTICAGRSISHRVVRRAGRRSAALPLLAPVRSGSV